MVEKKQKNRSKGRRNHKPSNESSSRILAPEHQKIALIGFRGVGKSLISQRLATSWNTTHISLDESITRKAGQSISEFVKASGWDAFRALELEVLKEISESIPQLVLDTGGGVVEGPEKNKSQEKIDILKRCFFCIYLYMDDDKLLERLKSSSGNAYRPSIAGSDAELKEVLRRRKPWYQEAADAIIDVSDVSVSEAAERVAQILRRVG